MNRKLLLLRNVILSFAFASSLQAQPLAGESTKRRGAVRPEAKWVTPPVTGPNLHHATFDSKAAGSKVSYLVYLPDAYEKNKGQRFPVVYWLHGIGGSQQGVPRMCGNISAAIAKGKMPPVIVVFANGMVDAFYNDAIHPPRPVETVIIKELIPHIDSRYRTIATRDARIMEGFSMGGYGAGHFGFKYPELFGSISMIDAAVLDLVVMKSRHGEAFQRIYGGNDETFNAAHPLILGEKNAMQIKGKTRIRLVVGALVGPNVKLHEKLTELTIAHDFTQLEGVGHNLAAIYDRLGDENWAFYAKAFQSKP